MKFRLIEKFIEQLKPEKYTDISTVRFEKNLFNIYELEYKLNKIKNNENFEHNKWMQELYKIGKQYLNENLNEILNIFEKIFRDWVEAHIFFIKGEEGYIKNEYHKTILKNNNFLKELEEFRTKSINEKIILLHKAKQMTHLSGSILEYLNLFYDMNIDEPWAFNLFKELSNLDTKIWDRELQKEGI